MAKAMEMSCKSAKMAKGMKTDKKKVVKKEVKKVVKKVTAKVKAKKAK